MSFSFGMPTLIEHNTLEESISLCKELGLKFIELNMNLPQYQIEKLENISYFQKCAEENAIYFTIHLDENLNIADFNQAVSEAYMETVRRTIEVAKQLKVPVINMHMNHGVYFTLPNQKVHLFEQYRAEYMEAFARFREMCQQYVGDSSIKICIENTNGYLGYEKEAIEYLLESPAFSLTWDIGHSNSVLNVDESFIRKHQERLTHFHIHDSLGKKDHMVLGTGEIDLQERLELAQKQNCACVVETKTIEALRESIDWLRQRNYC